jgi:hypothetical protein
MRLDHVYYLSIRIRIDDVKVLGGRRFLWKLPGDRHTCHGFLCVAKRVLETAENGK